MTAKNPHSFISLVPFYIIRIDTGLGLLFHEDNYARSYLLDKVGKLNNLLLNLSLSWCDIPSIQARAGTDIPRDLLKGSPPSCT